MAASGSQFPRLLGTEASGPFRRTDIWNDDQLQTSLNLLLKCCIYGLRFFDLSPHLQHSNNSIKYYMMSGLTMGSNPFWMCIQYCSACVCNGYICHRFCSQDPGNVLGFLSLHQSVTKTIWNQILNFSF